VSQLSLLAEGGACQHTRTERGLDAPRRFGSYQTEVCLGCRSFRTHGHDEAKSHKSEWMPESQYAATVLEKDSDA
jgi:hypothetical protein